MTWPNFDGKPYNRDQLAAHIQPLDFSKWRRKDGSHGRPDFITLHNTSDPDLDRYIKWSSQTRRAYIHNVQDYYENKLGWRGGPHFFVPPTLPDDPDVWAFGFNDLMSAGTHCSCFNNNSIGIEMFGEFNTEAFDSGPGASVAEHAIYLMALLHKQIGVSPDTLKFHIECARDNHDCPGTHARNKPDIIARIKAEMALLSGETPTAEPTSPAPIDTGRKIMFHAPGKMSTFGGPHDTGVGPDEGLALYTSAQQLADTLGGDWVLTADQAGAPGLARRINPDKFYLACRWPTDKYPFLRTAIVWVENPDGQKEQAHAVDWGPNVNTGRVADISPGLARKLGLNTDDHCAVTVYEDGK